MQTSDSIVIIPTYNERENIENIIRAVFGLPQVFHILVIEDGSPDGTAAIVRKLQQEFPEQLFMIERKGKLGLGTAYITGFKWALPLADLPLYANSLYHLHLLSSHNEDKKFYATFSKSHRYYKMLLHVPSNL